MHLIEVLMAGSVFAIASGSSLQLWSSTAVRAHQLTGREQLEQQIEQDRLQLRVLWRSSLQNQAQTEVTTADGIQAPAPTNLPTPESSCAATAAQLLALASNLAAPPNLQRDIQLSPDGRALKMMWQAREDTVIQRHRLVTPAGLGLCSLPAPEAEPTDELQPSPPPQNQSEPQSHPQPQPQPQPQPSDATQLTDSQVEGVPG